MGKFINTTKFLATATIAATVTMLTIGCDTTQKSTQSNAGLRNDVTDVRPIEPVASNGYQPPLYDTSAVVPTAPQVVTNDPIVASSAVTPVMSTTPDGRSHKVQHGETLFSIAKANYGDGKQWKKIASANPGISPSKLKVGQILAMP